MARWTNWKLRYGEVKSEPLELSDSPTMEVEGDENHVFPVRGYFQRAGIAGESARVARIAQRHRGPLQSSGHALPGSESLLW